MKKTFVYLLLAALLLSMAGCKSSGAADTDSSAAAPSSSGSGITKPTSEPTDPSEATDPTVATLPGEMGPVIPMNHKIRVPYNGTVRDVQYITSPEQLPDHTVFDQYDDAFFADNGLVLVTVTTSSGSVQLSIADIRYEGNEATVILSSEMDGNGTCDMATWLLWAVVDAGLDCQWSLKAATGENELPPRPISNH